LISDSIRPALASRVDGSDKEQTAEPFDFTNPSIERTPDGAAHVERQRSQATPLRDGAPAS